MKRAAGAEEGPDDNAVGFLERRIVAALRMAPRHSLIGTESAASLDADRSGRHAALVQSSARDGLPSIRDRLPEAARTAKIGDGGGGDAELGGVHLHSARGAGGIEADLVDERVAATFGDLGRRTPRDVEDRQPDKDRVKFRDFRRPVPRGQPRPNFLR